MKAQFSASEFEIEVDGRLVSARAGDTVAAALLRAGISTLRHTHSGRPRGVYCGMGVCFECLLTVDGMPDQRACITLARSGMRVNTGKDRVS